MVAIIIDILLFALFGVLFFYTIMKEKMNKQQIHINKTISDALETQKEFNQKIAKCLEVHERNNEEITKRFNNIYETNSKNKEIIEEGYRKLYLKIKNLEEETKEKIEQSAKDTYSKIYEKASKNRLKKYLK